MTENIKYKDSVFTLLFSQKDKLLALYNALSGENLGADTKIEINTLKNVLFRKRLNDISFLVNGVLVVLIEHQATINPNMPFRLMLYIAHLYEKIMDFEKSYSTTLLKIPRPEFYVLYNGEKPLANGRMELKLSDAFEFLEGKSKINLELTVPVIDINKGRNEELLSRDETLYGYAYFIDEVRGFERGGLPLEEAIDKASGACIKAGILADFLREHRAEVNNMLFGEWDFEREKEVAREEVRQEEREKSLQREREYQAQLKASSAQNQALQAEVNRLQAIVAGR